MRQMRLRPGAWARVKFRVVFAHRFGGWVVREGRGWWACAFDVACFALLCCVAVVENLLSNSALLVHVRPPVLSSTCA